MRILDFADDDDAVQATDTVDIAERVEHEVLVVFHVVGIDLDLEIVVARRVVALRDLVYRLHGVHELLYEVVRVLLEPDVAEYDDVVAEFVVVGHGCIARDVSFALKPLLPFKYWGRGEVYAGGDFLYR